MLKKTVTYENYDGVMVTEDLYFNLTRSEIMEMEYMTEGGYVDMLEKAGNKQDKPTMFKAIKDIVMKAYGEKSPDGKHFMKSEAISHAFSCTPAYDALFMELVTDADKSAKFFNAIIPEGSASNAGAPVITPNAL